MFKSFYEMKERGMQADDAVYNSLINGCASVGALDRAMHTLELMRSDGIEPTVITYTSLIKGCSMSGGKDGVSKAEEIFEAMQQRTNHFSSYVSPNQLTFEQLVYAHLNAGEAVNTTRIHELFLMMGNLGFLVDVPIIKSCLKVALLIDDEALAKITIMALLKQNKNPYIYDDCIDFATEICQRFGWTNVYEFADIFKLNISW